MWKGTCGAIIVCGGKSRRMGRPKAWLPFGSETLLQRVVRLVSLGLDEGPIAVVAAEGQELPELGPEMIVARDTQPGLGPLAAIVEGLRALPGGVRFAYVTGTDVPFLAPRWIGRLVELIGEADIAMPDVDGFDHPLASLYRRETVLPAAEGLLAAGRLRPVYLMELVEGRRVFAEELREVDPELLTLRNLNSPEDYEAALADAGLSSCTMSSPDVVRCVDDYS